LDPFKKKRQHKKTHGFIEFTTYVLMCHIILSARQSSHRVLNFFAVSSIPPSLSRVIATRWKQLPDHGKHFYRDVARADFEQYERYVAARGQRQGKDR
jgi:hypothetical protein